MGELAKSVRRGAGLRAVGATLPREHLLRRIDRLLDMTEPRPALAPALWPARATIDRPRAADPHDAGRAAFAIPSNRLLCEEVRYNIAYR